MEGNEKYFYDDTKDFGDLIAKNWKIKKPSTVLYYKEETDPNSHNYREDEVAVFINEGETRGNPGGIGFDCMTELKKNMYVYVSSLKRSNTTDVVNEILRILVENRLYSLNDWDKIAVVESRRVIPAYRYFQWVLKVELEDVVRPFTNAKGCVR